MKKLQKILCAVLAMFFAAGCTSGKSDDLSGDTAASADTASAQNTAVVEKTNGPALPELDLEGYTVHVYKLTQANIAWASVAFDVDEMTGDIMNDNTYIRNERLMEEYGFIMEDTEADNINEQIPILAQAGDTTYQAYLNSLKQISAQSLQGLFVNLRDVDTLFLDEDWWDQGMVRDLELFRNMYFINGDLNTGDNDNMQILYYNKQLAADLNITNLYELVRDGKWTIDRFSEMVSLAVHDVNGDGQMDHEDRYGILGSPVETVNSFFAGVGGRITTLDKDGIPQITAGAEASVNAAEAVSALYGISGGNYNYTKIAAATGLTQRGGIVQMFQDSRCLFYGNGISASAQYMRDIDVDYGFLPYPKLNEEQDTYYSKVAYSIPVFAIPVQCTEPEKTGLVLEILSRDSGESLMKDYYEVCFSSKYTRDEESYEMLLIADANHMYDPGNCYDWGTLGTQITNAIFANNGTYMSTVESNRNAAETEIASMVESFRVAVQK